MSSISNSIHFRGKVSVIEAYKNRDVDAWSLWQQKQFLTKGMGEADLDAFLTHLHNDGSQAVYTLKVYEDCTDLKAIKEKTECDGSFNFRLHEADNFSNGTGGHASYRQEIEKRMERIEQLLIERMEEEEDEEEEEPAGVIGAVVGLLNQPEKLEKLIQIGKALLMPGSQLQPGMVGNVNRLDGGNPNYEETRQHGPTTQPQNREEKLQRLGAAIDVLERHDSHLVEHMEKLSAMAATKPAQFQTLIGMLDVL